MQLKDPSTLPQPITRSEHRTLKHLPPSVQLRRIQWLAADELELLREACYRDFWAFFLFAFGAYANPKGERWIEEDVHLPLARWFQHHVQAWLHDRRRARGRQRHLAIIVHREVGKTTMITQAGQAWLHLRDPELSTYTGGEKAELAAQSLESIKAVLDGSDPYALFSKLYGCWDTGARRWTGKGVTHAARKNVSRKDPSLGIFAVETSIVGAHPDAIFYDDPISYERLLSDTSWLQTVNSQVTSLYPVIQGDGLIVWVGTRYGDDDHFGLSLRPTDTGGDGVRSIAGMPTRGFKIEPDSGQWHVYFMAGRDTEGRPTTPKVWPEDRLKRYERRDPLRYASQIMNDPSVSEFNPLTRQQIDQCVVPARQVPWNALVYYICCDTAFWDGRSRAKKDETVLIVQGVAKNGSGDVYVIEGAGSPTWRGEDFKKRLVSTVQKYRSLGRRVGGIVDEDPYAGKRGVWKSDLGNAFADANEPMPPFYELPRTTDGLSGVGSAKVRRMIGAAHYWVDGHVRVVEGGEQLDRLLDQMSRIGQYMINPKLQNDWADAHSMIFEKPIYHSMHRPEMPQPYAPGARPLATEGLRYEDFQDDPWNDAPRPPIR